MQDWYLKGAGAMNPDLAEAMRMVEPDDSRSRLMLDADDDPDEGEGTIIPARQGPPRGGYQTRETALGLGPTAPASGGGIGLLALAALAFFAFGRR